MGHFAGHNCFHRPLRHQLESFAYGSCTIHQYPTSFRLPRGQQHDVKRRRRRRPEAEQDGKGSRFFKADQIYGDPGSLAQEELEAIEGECFAFTGRRLMSDEQAIELMGMGTWRLREYVLPPFQEVIAWLEGTWRNSIETDLGLCPVDPKLKMCDSLDPDWLHEGEGYVEVPSPGSLDDAGYPRALIESRVYNSSIFRKLHLMIGVRQDGFKMLHCVIIPRLDFDIPIFSLDMLESGDRVTLATCDLFPVRPDGSIPEVFSNAIRQLQDKLGVQSPKEVPTWAREALSRHSLLMQPTSPQNLSQFIKYAIELHNLYMQVAAHIRNVPGWRTASAKRRGETYAGHARYVQEQLRHSKVCLAVEKAFGREWAHTFKTGLMFDLEPLSEDQPPGPLREHVPVSQSDRNAITPQPVSKRVD
eukprot:jgi/Botrbrau1/10600/Bobra.0358s0019.1